jgi:hypothetical protein
VVAVRGNATLSQHIVINVLGDELGKVLSILMLQAKNESFKIRVPHSVIRPTYDVVHCLLPDIFMHLLVTVQLDRNGAEQAGAILNHVLQDQSTLGQSFCECFVALLPLVGRQNRLLLAHVLIARVVSREGLLQNLNDIATLAARLATSRTDQTAPIVVGAGAAADRHRTVDRAQQILRGVLWRLAAARIDQLCWIRTRFGCGRCDHRAFVRSIVSDFAAFVVVALVTATAVGKRETIISESFSENLLTLVTSSIFFDLKVTTNQQRNLHYFTFSRGQQALTFCVDSVCDVHRSPFVSPVALAGIAHKVKMESKITNFFLLVDNTITITIRGEHQKRIRITL